MMMVRPNQTFDHEGLRAEAEKAAESWGGTKTELADALGVSPAAISRAIRIAGSKFATLQRRIVELVTGYSIAEEVTFKAGSRKNVGKISVKGSGDSE